MPEFISKLQYKTYEDGEYSDEKARNLEETFELIKNFPWAIEQYADLGLTGPSITILDENGNYLKAGIYYGGKYSLYYLDSKNHYYEKKNITIEIVYDKVTEFFSQKIDLQNFQKQSFAFGLKSLFVTNGFEYHIKLWKILLLSIFWIIYFLMFLGLTIALDVFKPFKSVGLFPILFMLLFGWPLGYIFENYFQKRNQYLKISRGNDIFLFGDDKIEIKNYNKNDIIEIIRYEDRGNRSPNLFEIFEVVFNDNTSIKFSNALISYFTLREKFSDKWKLPTTTIRQNIFKITLSLS
jgi:hypothetical protein